MSEPGGKSVRCQNLHEPLLSPCMFEPKLSLRLIFSSCADALFSRLVFSSTLIFVHAIRVLVSFCAVVAGRLPHARPSRASAQYIRRDWPAAIDALLPRIESLHQAIQWTSDHQDHNHANAIPPSAQVACARSDRVRQSMQSQREVALSIQPCSHSVRQVHQNAHKKNAAPMEAPMPVDPVRSHWVVGWKEVGSRSAFHPQISDRVFRRFDHDCFCSRQRRITLDSRTSFCSRFKGVL